MANQIKPWMMKLATVHAMNEAATKNLDAKAILESWGNMHMNPDANFAGMGEPTLPTGSMNPDGSFTGIDNTGAYGSGDMPSSTLPMAMNIAAATIALELLPTVPISTALTILPYVNGVYSGGASNRNLGVGDRSNKNMRLVKAVLDFDGITVPQTITDAKEIAAFKALAKTTILDALKGNAAEITAAGTATGAKVTFTGMLSFYDKSPIFEIVYAHEAYRNGATGDSAQEGTGFANIFDGGANRGPLVTTMPVSVKVPYTYIDTTDPDAPEEKEGEATITSVGIVKFDTVKTYEDFVPFFTGVSKYGTDGKFANGNANGGAWANYNYDLATLNPYLRSEGEVTPANKVSLQMDSSKVDAKTIKITGEITREQFQDMTSYGYDPYGFINAILTNECSQRINFDILKALHTLGKKHADAINFNAKIVVSDVLHENSLTIQKQVVSKFNLASNIISTRSRVSPADWVVVGAGIGTAIMDMPTFMATPATTFAAASGNNAIYCIGNIGRLKVYIDPYLEFDSTACLVGAVGTEQSPGLKFMPYILADQVTYPSEALGGQNLVSMTSRYAIAPAGAHPESLYLGFNLKLAKVDGVEATFEAIFPYLG